MPIRQAKSKVRIENHIFLKIKLLAIIRHWTTVFRKTVLQLENSNEYFLKFKLAYQVNFIFKWSAFHGKHRLRDCFARPGGSRTQTWEPATRFPQ